MKESDGVESLEESDGIGSAGESDPEYGPWAGRRIGALPEYAPVPDLRPPKFFPVSDFARVARITRAALYHYDRIGLLSPPLRRGNNYRYYSINQLPIINLIRTLQDLGMTLEEIKKLKSTRSPELTDKLLVELMEKIDEKFNVWNRARKLLLTLQKSIRSASEIDEESITIEFLPAERIILSDQNDYSRGRNLFDALHDFYQSVAGKHPDLNLNYPVWGCFSEKRIKRGDWVWPDRYYFYNPEGPDSRPAALYAIGYTRGGYGQTDGLYRRLISHIDRNGFEVCGDAYEEYPLNEICIADDANYLIRVMVAVSEKKASAPAGPPGEDIGNMS